MEIRDVLQKLLDETVASGGQSAWAKQYGLSPQYVSDVLHGRRDPGAGILIALGLKRIVTYAPLGVRKKPQP
jgi:hypothetical protein